MMAARNCGDDKYVVEDERDRRPPDQSAEPAAASAPRGDAAISWNAFLSTYFPGAPC